MKRVIVIGCSGSGKSTFSRKLREKTGLPLHYLDMIFHKPDKTTLSREEFDTLLMQILENDEWIIDGNYQRTMALRLGYCDTVIWLDYPLDVCLSGIEQRRGHKREDLPWIEDEVDEEFIGFVKGFERNVRPEIIKLLESTQGKRIIVFKTRDESDGFLESLKQVR